MRIHLALISCLLFLLALACAAPSAGGEEGSTDDTGRSSGGSASCYDVGYDDCYYGYYPVATCDVTAYCTGYCDCDGWGEYCDVCA